MAEDDDKPLKKARYVWEVKGKCHLKPHQDEEDEAEDIPVTLVVPSQKNQDYYLNKWQARQIARSFVDNTINRVLESYQVPLQVLQDLGHFNEEEDDGQVEDEGILMAIQSHGLQAASNSGALLRQQELEKSTLDNLENSQNEMTLKRKLEQQPEEDSMDFLNAAVSVAIQKKGLSSCSF